MRNAQTRMPYRSKPQGFPERQSSSSWQKVSSWYTKSVGESGHYYHEHVVLPATLELLHLKSGDAVLDLACGQGVLERKLPQGVGYMGVDISPSLIGYARDHAVNPSHRFLEADITRPLNIPKDVFTHATIVLALQNIEFPDQALLHASEHLLPGGMLVLMLNHPCFRIPRQSSWGIDERNKIQYRRIDRYLSPLKIPIAAAPSQGKQSSVTWSYHRALSDYSAFLQKAGFVIELIQELGSDKVSVGRAAKMENRSRNEIPLFMAIKARKMKTDVRG
jgi:ubiquinone/menaquinone biosynthesis C-methylase UbiE